MQQREKEHVSPRLYMARSTFVAAYAGQMVSAAAAKRQKSGNHVHKKSGMGQSRETLMTASRRGSAEHKISCAFIAHAALSARSDATRAFLSLSTRATIACQRTGPAPVRQDSEWRSSLTASSSPAHCLFTAHCCQIPVTDIAYSFVVVRHITYVATGARPSRLCAHQCHLHHGWAA